MTEPKLEFCPICGGDIGHRSDPLREAIRYQFLQEYYPQGMFDLRYLVHTVGTALAARKFQMSLPGDDSDFPGGEDLSDEISAIGRIKSILWTLYIPDKIGIVTPLIKLSNEISLFFDPYSCRTRIDFGSLAECDGEIDLGLYLVALLLVFRRLGGPPDSGPEREVAVSFAVAEKHLLTCIRVSEIPGGNPPCPDHPSALEPWLRRYGFAVVESEQDPPGVLRWSFPLHLE